MSVNVVQMAKPANQSGGKWNFIIRRRSDQVQVNAQQPTSPSCTFTSVPDGQYTAVARRLDTVGNVLGTSAVVDFDVVTPAPAPAPEPPPPEMVDVAGTTLSVSVIY